MKFVKDTEDNLLQTLEYDLDDCCRRNDAPVGVLILCALLNYEDFSVTCLITDEESETGTVPEKVRIDSSRIADFSGIGVLAGMFRKFGLRKWLVRGKYQNAALEVFGRADSTIVSVSCQSDARFDLFWLMSSLEAGTYDYTDCDEALLGWAETKYWMPRKRAIQAIQELQGHEDIYSEFRAGISDQGFAFPAADPVCIAGYTALTYSP